MAPKQKVPDIAFDFFTIAELPDRFKKNEIVINKDYQRGFIWKPQQQIELIKSIESRYSIGVLVLFVNDNGQYEILDGQQRILTVKKYIEDKMDLGNSELKKYGELSTRDKALLDAYCIYYLKLKSHDPETKEEDIVQTFLRLQEGTPLNKAEKINAYRGKFKDLFCEVRETHPLFKFLGTEKRFRWRQLAAELLLVELESDFDHLIFPNLDLQTFKKALKDYESNISTKKERFFKGNLDYLHNSLNLMLTALQPREILAFYLLVSYLRKKKADNTNLVNEFAEFARLFLENLNSFSVYDINPPPNVDRKIFDTYKKYKLEAKVMTTSESIRERFDIVLAEFDRLHPFIIKDEKRLHDTEQKRILFFRQQGICPVCNKAMDFRSNVEAHHGIAHSEGGQTDDLSHAILVHEKCHDKIEKDKKKEPSKT